jgi:hypothetical protein
MQSSSQKEPDAAPQDAGNGAGGAAKPDEAPPPPAFAAPRVGVPAKAPAGKRVAQGNAVAGARANPVPVRQPVRAAGRTPVSAARPASGAAPAARPRVIIVEEGGGSVGGKIFLLCVILLIAAAAIYYFSHVREGKLPALSGAAGAAILCR